MMFKNTTIFFILCFIFGSVNLLYSQSPVTYKGTRYYPIPKEYSHSTLEKSQYDEELKKYNKKGFDAETAIRINNFEEDLTDKLQKVVDENQVVILPNRDVFINENGLKLKSNQVLIFQEKTRLKSIPNNKTHFAVLIINEIKNVKIFNANILGERFEHIGNKGQWGMGIRIMASENVQLYNPTVKEMWGDGIYIGGRNGKPSENIEVYNAFLDNNRRNGLSITSADGVKLIKPLVANSNGQSPKAGIDIEPNSNDDIINNIVIDSPICFYNPIYGIVVSLTRLPGVKQKDVNVVINKPLIIGGKYGIAVLGIYNNPNGYKITGNIKIENLTTYYTALSIKEFLKPQFGIKINVSNMNIYHMSKRGEIYSNDKQIKKFQDNLKILE